MNLVPWNLAASKWLEYQSMRKARPDDFLGVPSGLTLLDKHLGGIPQGAFIAVIGRNKAGKTALMLTLALNLAKTIKVIYFTMEMSVLQLMTRSVANRSEVAMNTIRDLQYDETIWARFERASRDFANLKGGIVYGIRDMGIAHRIIEEENPDVIVFDYFNLMDWVEIGEKSLYRLLTSISHDMKNLTLPGGIDDPFPEMRISSGTRLRTIITAAQVDKATKRSGATVKDSSSLGTGAIEDDGDVLIAVNSIFQIDGKKEVPDARELTVSGRVCETATFRVKFDPSQARFFDDTSFDFKRRPIT